MNKRIIVNIGLTTSLVIAAAVANVKIQDWLLETGLISAPFDRTKWITLKHPATMALPPLKDLTEPQVQNLLGPPDKSLTETARTIYSYHLGGVTVASFEPLKITFTNGKVSSCNYCLTDLQLLHR
ncbi:MAG: hypothetical protein K2W95_17445 [Candidatus Obscuribacterales bacterium]|nr:hypothetical protein [Candidatus Obscuribacterales bacterium]